MLEGGGSIAEEAGEFCPERMMDGTREAIQMLGPRQPESRIKIASCYLRVYTVSVPSVPRKAPESHRSSVKVKA